eukprot:scaffold12145_cov139-Amphora_coffeaeformis.AAC.3
MHLKVDRGAKNAYFYKRGLQSRLRYVECTKITGPTTRKSASQICDSEPDDEAAFYLSSAKGTRMFLTI